MTKEEKQKAIDALKISAPIMAVTQEEFDNYIHTLNQVMDWLEQELTTKNDLGVDCISRKAVLDGFEKYSKGSFAYGCVWDYVKNLPSVTPQEPKTGHWNEIPKYKDIAWRCSECEHFTTMKHNFCPNCGADMREVEE